MLSLAPPTNVDRDICLTSADAIFDEPGQRAHGAPIVASAFSPAEHEGSPV
jgi:hypothetical protein